MMIAFAFLWRLFTTIVAIEKDAVLLNGAEFPSSIYVPLDKSYLLECSSTHTVHWKLYSNNGRIETINEKLIRLNEFDKNRDGLYQCHSNSQLRSVFIFSNGARSIERQWTNRTQFHTNLLTVCRPLYFHYGFNEQLIELIDKKQTVRYNRSALLVKHIRSTTHLFCKLHIDTTCVGVRVQTLIDKSKGGPLLSDEALKTNDYLDMKTPERDFHRIAFEGDTVYFHCPSKETLPVQWTFLSSNFYLIKTLPTLHDQDTKLNAVTIKDTGMYTCQTANTVHQRIVLTILHSPKSPDNTYEHTLHVNFYSKYLLCCNLDGTPYPTYSWSMVTSAQTTPFVWCAKRCCWLHVLYREYQNVICTSANQFGMAKYNVHLIVQETGSEGTIVYEEPKSHHHNNHTNHFIFIHKENEI